jgi:hypothetical protein
LGQAHRAPPSFQYSITPIFTVSFYSPFAPCPMLVPERGLYAVLLILPLACRMIRD